MKNNFCKLLGSVCCMLALGALLSVKVWAAPSAQTLAAQRASALAAQRAAAALAAQKTAAQSQASLISAELTQPQTSQKQDFLIAKTNNMAIALALANMPRPLVGLKSGGNKTVTPLTKGNANSIAVVNAVPVQAQALTKAEDGTYVFGPAPAVSTDTTGAPGSKIGAK